MTPREELVSKWKNKGQTVSTVPVTDVLSPVQNLTKYNRIPVELANKLSIQKTLPTPSFAQKEIQPPKTSFKVKTTTPTVTTKTTGSVLRGAGQTAKEGGSLFVDVLRAVPEIRGQIESPGGKSGIYSALGALETSVGQVVKTVAEQKSLVPQPEGIMRKTVQNGLRELSDRLMSAGEEDFKTGEMLAESLPKFSFETKNERHKAIAAGIVQNAPNLLGGLLVGGGTALVTKNPSATTATLLAYTSALEGGFAYREAKQLGADDAQARKMMVRVGIANGILETLPISRFLNRSMATRNVKKQILSNVAKSIAQAGFEEGTTEGLQEMVLNFTMKEVDKNRDLFQGVPESAFFGAILGGGIAGGKAAYDKAKEDSGGKLRLGMSIEDVSGGKATVPTVEKSSIAKAKEEGKTFEETSSVDKKALTEPGITTSSERMKDAIKTKENAVQVKKEYQTQLEESNANITRDGVANATTWDINARKDAADALKTIREIESDLPTRAELQSEWNATENKETPQVDETAIQKTAQDIEDAFADVESMLEISEYGQGGQLKEDTEGNKSRQKGIWPAFMPEDMHSKADVVLAGELLSGKEAKTDRQKKLYQSILKFVSDKVGADRFTDYEYAQLLQRMSDEATAERKVFIDKLVADLKKNRRALTPAETREAIKKTTEQEKSPVIQKRESTLLKDRIRTLARGYREGAKLGKDGVYETQSELIDLIEESGMTKEDRAGFIRTIRNVQTDEQLQKALPELQERIDRVVSETEKKQIRKEIIKIVKRVGDSPTVALEYKQRIKELISAFELKGHSKDTIEKLQKARAFLTEQASQGKDVEIPTRLLSNLEILNRTPFDAIPVDTLRSVLEDIKFLEKLGRTKFRVKQEVYQYEKDNILQEIKDGSQPLEKAEVAIPKPGERLSKSQKFKNYINSVINQFARIDKVISPMDVVLDTLDGAPGTYDGANYRNIKLRFDRDFNAYLQQKYQIQDPVHALADKNNFDERNYTRIGLVAAREQSGGTEKLLNNGYSQEEIDAVELTPQERELLELMKVQMDSQFPMIQQVQKDVYNLDVKKVDNYFSFMTDWALMDEAEVYLRMGPDVAEFGKNFQDVGDRVKSNIDPSFVKKRAGAGRQKIDINAMVVFMKHTDNTAYFLNFARDTKMMGEIVRGEEYREAVGDLGQLLMLEYVDLMSRQGGASGANQIAMLDWMRKNVSAGILGLKLSTVAIQWTAVLDGMGFIGPVYGSRGINSFVTDKELRDMVLSFPEMRERVGGETALEELKNSDSWLADIQKKGFIPLQKVDMVAAGSVALGAYMQKMDAIGKQIDPNNINKEAMEYAQLALRRTQSSSLFKDVPMAISRGSMTGNRSWDRAIFQFQTFLLTRWSRVRHDAIRVGITNKDPKQAINVLFWIMLSSVAATGTRMAVKGLTDMILDAEPPEEDEDKMPYWQSSLIREMAGTVPFMGNLIGSYMYDSAFMPILDTPQNALEGAKKMFEGVQPETKARGFIEFSTSIGAMFGVPGSIQAQQVLKGIVEPADTKKTDREKILDKYKNSSTKTDREKILEKYR